MLADVVEVVVLTLVLVLWVVALWIPSVLALADETTILVLDAIVASEGGISTAAR